MGFRRMLQLRGAGRATLAALTVAVALGMGAGSAPAATNPLASYTFAPAKPLVGVPIAFASTATPGSSPILSQAWGFHNDGPWDSLGAAPTPPHHPPGVYPV